MLGTEDERQRLLRLLGVQDYVPRRHLPGAGGHRIWEAAASPAGPAATPSPPAPAPARRSRPAAKVAPPRRRKAVVRPATAVTEQPATTSRRKDKPLPLRFGLILCRCGSDGQLLLADGPGPDRLDWPAERLDRWQQKLASLINKLGLGRGRPDAKWLPWPPAAGGFGVRGDEAQEARDFFAEVWSKRLSSDRPRWILLAGDAPNWLPAIGENGFAVSTSLADTVDNPQKTREFWDQLQGLRQRLPPRVAKPPPVVAEPPAPVFADPPAPVVEEQPPVAKPRRRWKICTYLRRFLWYTRHVVTIIIRLWR